MENVFEVERDFSKKLAALKNIPAEKREEILKNIASFMAGLEIGQNLNPEGDKKNEN